MSVFHDMIARYAQPGKVQALLLRGARRHAPTFVDRATVQQDGLVGDHGRPGKRAVTLIQAEHLPVIAALLGRAEIDPLALRRNIVVAGLNLNALKGRKVQIGTATLRITGICAPCSRMEETFGPGGYSAVRGHGGWCAEVLTPGAVAVGDPLTPLAEDD